MQIALQELRRAFRSLAKDPGSAAVAVVVLALGIGLSGFMLTLMYGVFVRGMEIAEPDRVLVLNEVRIEESPEPRFVPIRTFADWRERQTSFRELFAHSGGTTFNVVGPESPVRLQGNRVTANAFAALGVEPVLGRAFAEGDDRPGAPALLVLAHRTWRQHFGADSGVVGRPVRVNGETGTIIGVMPEGFGWPDGSQGTEAWTPLRVDPLATPRGSVPVGVWGRLRAEATHDLAAEEMQGIARQLAEEHPEVNAGVQVMVTTPSQIYNPPQIRQLLVTMAAAVGLVLLVACFNVGSVLLARATARMRAAGIRKALGAGRVRVMLPFVAEALVLSALGAALGVGIAVGASGWFDEATRSMRPWYIRLDLEWPVLLSFAGLMVLTALLASLAPALHLRRTDVETVLKDESRGTPGRRTGRLARFLVTGQVAVSCLLLVGAVVMAASMARVATTDYPFETDRVLTARIGLPGPDYPGTEDRRRFWRELRRELAAEPAIAAASLARTTPYFVRLGFDRRPVIVEARDGGDPEAPRAAHRLVVAPGFFETYGVEVTAGRDFRNGDDDASMRVAIVNQPMVERFFGGGNPVGRRFREGTSDTLPPLTVVGVVPDLHASPRFGWIQNPDAAAYYVPLDQSDHASLSIVARSRGEAGGAIAADVRRAVGRVDPSLPAYWVQTQREVIEYSSIMLSSFGTVFLTFGLSALFMASVGLYGVLSFGVARRTSEVGIRIALGADPARVVWMVVGQATRQVGLGLLFGLLAALAAAPVLSFLVFDVDPRDPLVFAAVTLLILGVGLLASFVPARRAASVDPVAVIRTD